MRALLAFALRRTLFLLAVALPSLGAARELHAQTDVIRGKVTTLEGLPLPSVRVTATSIPGNVTREARSDNRGSFQIVFPGGTGDYIMGYALIGYGFRQFEIKRKEPKASFDLRVAQSVTNPLPVLFLNQECDLFVVAHDHENRIHARAQFRILQKTRPVLM